MFSTITGWLKNVLTKAGIDIDPFDSFKAHSARSVSTSKADFCDGIVLDIYLDHKFQ